MNSKILKVFYAIFIAVILVILIIMVVSEINGGIDTSTRKLWTGLYFLTILWAVYRLFTLLRDIFRKS